MYASVLVWDNGKNLGITSMENENLLSRIVCSIWVVNVIEFRSVLIDDDEQ